MAKNKSLPSPGSLKAEARRQLKALVAELKKASAEGSVHGARRHIKRLRSLLRLIRQPIGEKAYDAANAKLRTAADSLAGQRRAEALLAASMKLGSRSKPHPLLTIAETHRREHAADGAAGEQIDAARLAVAEAAAALAASRIQRGEPAQVAKAFMDCYGKARKQLSKALAAEEAEALHEARKTVIHHLHHLDLLSAHLKGPGGRRLEKLDALREALGDLNDLDELSQLAAAHGASPRKDDSEALEKRRGKLLAKARRLSAPLFRDKPKVFARRMGLAHEIATD